MEYVDDKFEWNLAKAVRNLREHKVSFEEAAAAFVEPRAIDDYLADDSHEEDRFKRLCLGADGLLVVIYAEREDDHEITRVRIISVWRANKHEQARYNAG